MLDRIFHYRKRRGGPKHEDGRGKLGQCVSDKCKLETGERERGRTERLGDGESAVVIKLMFPLSAGVIGEDNATG